MGIDLQKASFGKRIIAHIFDVLLVCVLAVGFITMLSSVLGYDSYIEKYEANIKKYEAQYNVKFEITEQEYNAFSDAQRENYDAACKAFSEDKNVLKNYNMTVNLILIMFTFGFLLSIVALEFVVPLLLKNGQTIGKKIFGIGLMHIDGIKVSNVQIFARAILGKFAIELMIPLYIIIMLSFSAIGIVGITILIILLITELICLASSDSNPLIHDKLSQTVAVDLASQKIFNTREELIAHVKAIHAERASRAIY